MAQIKIGEKEYQLKYTLESWKKLKEKCDITPHNVQDKINEDAAGSLSNLVFYGLNPTDRNSVTTDFIDVNLGFGAVDNVLEAVMEDMPVAGKAGATSEGAGAEKK